MNTVESIQRMWRSGQLGLETAAFCYLDVLDSGNVDEVLPTLPRAILFPLHCYSYTPPGQKWFSLQVGEIPGPEPHRLAALAAWFARHKDVYDAEGDSREKRMQRALDAYRKRGGSHPGDVALIAAVRFLDLVAPEEAPAATANLPRDVLWYVREILAEGPPRIWTNLGAVVATETEGVSAVHDWIAEHGAAWDAAEHARDWKSLTGTWEATKWGPMDWLVLPNEETRPTDPRWRLTLLADGGGSWTTPDEEAGIAFEIDVTPKYKSIAIRFASGPRRGESIRLNYDCERETLRLHRPFDEEWNRSIERKVFEGVYARVEGPPT